MIPRQLDLVPEIRGPLSDDREKDNNNFESDVNKHKELGWVSDDSCNSNDNKTWKTTSITRYILMPSLSNWSSNSINMKSEFNSKVDATPIPSHSLQLVSFIASSECTTAPIELIEMSSQVYQREQHNMVDNDDDDDDDHDSNDDSDVERMKNSKTISLIQHNNNTREYRNRNGKQKTNKKIISRSFYKSNAPSSSLRFSSIPLPEYEEFTPILIHWPEVKHTEANKICTLSTSHHSPTSITHTEMCQASVLPSPIIELRCERVQLSSSQPSSLSKQSISSNWLSSQSTRIKKSDWKNMDAYDKEIGKQTRWSMEEAVDSDVIDNNSVGSDKYKGRSKKISAWEREASSSSFLTTASNSYSKTENKNERNSRGVLKRARDSVFALQSRIQIPRLHHNTLSTFLHDGYNEDVNDSTKRDAKIDNTQQKITNSSNENVADQHLRVKMKRELEDGDLRKKNVFTATTITTASVSLTSPQVKSITELPPPEQPPSSFSRHPINEQKTVQLTTLQQQTINNNNNINSNNNNNNNDNTSTSNDNVTNELDNCAVIILDELRKTGKESASMKELERLILKKLPDYALVAEKSRNVATKADAVKWFHDKQQQLRHWLSVKKKYIIDNAGNVYFTESVIK